MRVLMISKKTEIGQSLLIVAMGFVAIIAFIGFAIDTGILFLNRVWLSQAVDAATLSAGYELPNIQGACARAVEYLGANDYVAGSKFTFEIVFPSVPSAPGGDPGEFVINSDLDGIRNPADCVSLLVPNAHENVHYEVQVAGRQLVPVAFMGILGFGDVVAGVNGLVERTHKFDIALVLDNSGSMDYDTCGYHRDVSGDPEGFTTYAANNVYPLCKPIVGDDFESYGSTDELIVEWYKTGATSLHTSGGHDGGHWVEVSEGELANTFDVSGQQDVAVYFWMKNLDMDQNDEFVDVQWRIWDGVTSPAPSWIPLSTFQGNNLPNVWTEYGIVLPTGAADTEYLSIRFVTREVTDDFGDESFAIDDVSFKNCPPVREQLMPVLQYVSGGADGCATSSQASDMDAHIYVPWTLNPRVPIDVNAEPVTELLQQPMYDVLRSTETFIDLIDARRFDTNPPLAREDQFSLTTFSTTGNLLYDLTLDYETLKDTLFKGIGSDSYTNIGDGMRIGVDTLSGGRSDTIHFMVLLSDGWPNRYGSSGNSCGSSMPCPETFTWIDQQIDYAISGNVTIFTIGLGKAMTDVTFSAYGDPNYNGQKLLERIAQDTGGSAYFAPTTEELEQIFEWIAEAIFVRLKG
jgi:hypothetical protein